MPGSLTEQEILNDVFNPTNHAIQVDIVDATGVTITASPASEIADDAAFTPATSKVVPAGFTADETATDSVDEGDAGAARMTLNRRQITASESADDAAPETGTKPSMQGFVFDDVTPDSVDEGDIGYGRMSANRNQYVTIRDAAGNERGLNIAADGSLANTGSEVLTDDAAFTPATSKVAMIGAQADETGTDSVDEGDGGALRMTLNRRVITAGQVLDDAAFGIGTEYVTPAGFLADETGTDSVDEGDVGLARMTLNRRQILAGQTLDDAAFGIGTEYVMAGGFLADESGTDSVDEGDIGAARMTLDRRQRVANKSVEGPGEPTVDSYTHAAISAAVTTADQSLVAAPGANKQIWVYGINFVTAAAGTVSFQDEDNTAISGVMAFAANGGMAVAPSGNFSMPLWKVATNKALEVDTASGADAKGSLTYAIVSV